MHTQGKEGCELGLLLGRGSAEVYPVMTVVEYNGRGLDGRGALTAGMHWLLAYRRGSRLILAKLQETEELLTAASTMDRYEHKESPSWTVHSDAVYCQLCRILSCMCLAWLAACHNKSWHLFARYSQCLLGHSFSCRAVHSLSHHLLCCAVLYRGLCAGCCASVCCSVGFSAVPSFTHA